MKSFLVAETQESGVLEYQTFSCYEFRLNQNDSLIFIPDCWDDKILLNDQ